MMLCEKCFRPFSKRSEGMSRFTATLAYTRSFCEFVGVWTVKIFSSVNHVLANLATVSCRDRRLQAASRFTLSACVSNCTSRRRNTLSCKSNLAIRWTVNSPTRYTSLTFNFSRRFDSFKAIIQAMQLIKLIVRFILGHPVYIYIIISSFLHHHLLISAQGNHQ